MAIDRDTTITWYGHACVEVRTPGGKVVLFDPWFGNPSSPRSADSVDRCDVMLVTHGHGDHMGDAVALASRLRPAWPCIHEMSLWLARRLPGGADAAMGMNKGGTVEVDGLRVTMVHADHSAGDWNADGSVPLYLGEPVGLRRGAGERLPALSRRRYRGLRRHAAHPRPVSPGSRDPADRRPLHDGAAGGRAGGGTPGRRPRHADPSRHVPAAAPGHRMRYGRSWRRAVWARSRSMLPCRAAA